MHLDMHGLVIFAALARNASITRRNIAGSWFTVIKPSAHDPATRAVSSDTAAPKSGGATNGRLQIRARSMLTSPSCVTSSPRRSARGTLVGAF